MVSVVQCLIDEGIIGFSSAEGFVRHLKITSPDLSAIFLDINLSGITDIELMQAIKLLMATKMFLSLYAAPVMTVR